MEHRCSERRVNTVNIIISRYDQPIAIGRIKNGNRYGLYIESDMDLRPLQPIGIEINVGYKRGKPLKVKFNAMVIHANRHGFGVELDVMSAEESDVLARLLDGQSARIQGDTTEPRVQVFAATA